MPAYKLNFDSIRPYVRWSYTTRRLIRSDAAIVWLAPREMGPGDIVLCEVVDVGQVDHLRAANANRYALNQGDLIVVCLGNYDVPPLVRGSAEPRGESAALLSEAGVAGSIEATGAVSTYRPTRLRVVGSIADANGTALDIRRYAIAQACAPDDITVLGVIGSEPNSGALSTAKGLAHGLIRAGFAVEGIKATGTEGFEFIRAFHGLGLNASDFTDAGLVTTSRAPVEDIERCFESLLKGASSRGATIAIIELDDSLLSKNSHSVLAGSAISTILDGILITANEVNAAHGALATLAACRLVPFAISGRVAQEVRSAAELRGLTDLPIVSPQALSRANKAATLVMPCLRHRAPSKRKHQPAVIDDSPVAGSRHPAHAGADTKRTALDTTRSTGVVKCV